MTITELRYCLSLPGRYMRMIEKFLTDNHIEFDSFAIVSRNLLFETEFNPNPLRIAWVQDGELVEESQIQKDKFFFQIVDSLASEKCIIVPVPPDMDE